MCVENSNHGFTADDGYIVRTCGSAACLSHSRTRYWPRASLGKTFVTVCPSQDKSMSVMNSSSLFIGYSCITGRAVRTFPLNSHDLFGCVGRGNNDVIPSMLRRYLSVVFDINILLTDSLRAHVYRESRRYQIINNSRWWQSFS